MESENQNNRFMRIPHSFPKEYKEIAPLLRPAIEQCWNLLPDEERTPQKLSEIIIAVALAQIHVFVNEQLPK